MKTAEYEITFPKLRKMLEQNEEWIILDGENGRTKLKLHDYGRIYSVPGLYEEIFYNRLKCDSPNVVGTMLAEELEKMKDAPAELRVLDFGAGNGMVGECLKEKVECSSMVGIDIIPEAMHAAWRDRPHVYDVYYVMDLNNLNKKEEETLKDWDFNTLVTVAALGFEDIPTFAFVNAFNIIEKGGLVAFNIKTKFLMDEDKTGFHEILDRMFDSCLKVVNSKKYCHRYSLTGDKIYYQAIVGRKLKDAHIS